MQIPMSLRSFPYVQLRPLLMGFHQHIWFASPLPLTYIIIISSNFTHPKLPFIHSYVSQFKYHNKILSSSLFTIIHLNIIATYLFQTNSILKQFLHNLILVCLSPIHISTIFFSIILLFFHKTLTKPMYLMIFFPTRWWQCISVDRIGLHRFNPS